MWNRFRSYPSPSPLSYVKEVLLYETEFIITRKVKLYNRKPAPNSNYEIHTLKG